MINLDFYCSNDSFLTKIIPPFLEDCDFLCNFFEVEKLTQNNGDRMNSEVVFLEEDDSFVCSSDFFENIISKYNNKPPIIIISSNNEVFNVVKWMRKGASDYLLKNELTKDILLNSINDSLTYIKKDNPSCNILDQNEDYINGRIVLPTNFDWNSLLDNQYYEMAPVMLTINFDKDFLSRYSKSSIEKIYENIKNEISLISSKFGGRIWVSQNNSFILSFYFGDYINCSALFGIYFFNRFFLLCVEKLKLDEVLKLKMSIHAGNCLFHKTNTEQITSDVINSLVHIENQYNTDGNIAVSETVYKNLSKRLSKFFSFEGEFEGKKIYIFSTSRDSSSSVL
ncbi:MAG TPA: hypothetical protein PLO89_01660 [Spirochaetota bacterium]|nr:hypothetical protein [Spirochaetota bacterium]